MKLSHALSPSMKQKMSSLNNDKRKRLKMMVRMQQSQLPIEKNEEDSESTKHVNVV